MAGGGPAYLVGVLVNGADPVGQQRVRAGEVLLRGRQQGQQVGRVAATEGVVQAVQAGLRVRAEVGQRGDLTGELP